MNKTFKLAALGAVAFAVAACGGGGGDDDGAGSGGSPVVGRNGTVDVGSVSMPGGQTCNIPGFAQALIAEINAARAKARNCGATSFPAAPAIGYWNTKLTEASIRHSSDMAGKNFFSHTGSDGSTPFDRVISADYKQGGSGEILMRSTSPDVKRFVNVWLASEGHCKIIMDPSHKELGGACVAGSGNTYTTVNFGW